MNLYLRLCILVGGLVCYQPVRAQITITSAIPASMCGGSPINVSYGNTYSGQATLSLYLYSASSTDSVIIAQLNTSGGNGTLSAYLPTGLATKTYTVGIKLAASQTTYLSPRSNDFLISAIPAAPVAASVIVYCQNSTAVPLSATASPGGTLNWYMAPFGGIGSTVAPTPTTAPVGTSTYYVSQSINGCEGPRTSITVFVKAMPAAPVATSVIVYCQNSTAVPLSATASPGGTLNWYTAPFGGIGSTVGLVPTTSFAGVSIYYVSQSINGCEGPRAAISVAVMPNPAVSITPNRATLTAAQTSLTLTANTSASTLRWSTGESTASILVNTIGVYSVTATSSTGCSATASSNISQASTSDVYSVKAGNWDDSTIWSVNRIPTHADTVLLRHSVSLPTGYQAQALQVRYDGGGILQMGADSYVKLGL